MAELTVSGTTHPILKDDYASEWMGIEVVALDDGHATIRMALRQEMLNGFGMAHGGMIFAFGDTAFALACNPANPDPAAEGTITVASGVDINFIKPAFRGQVLTAVANRRASTGRSGLYDIQIYAADPGTGNPTAAPAGTAPVPTVPGELPTDNATDAPAWELVAEFRGRSRTISKK
ncbi:phenylacetic acid degradation protein PaaD [Arthrobacter sp. NicSoilB4]|uniref:hotdog fold thioesterase n=1 Tax=Arthrobacter sp. NicSoilB4 TaxID=2830997 RepID=UPI001CC435F9|nr:hotdog fold thioesterase [Arthrobacter sp. NicSoilB4]BCW68201.1 phenylacetic acid degradation protein PaaD [Arthrobacter sp. NicSoilB4]